MNTKLINHPSYTHTSDIADLCKPLERLNITYFTHVYVTNDKKFSYLTNNPQFATHYLRNKYYNADIHLAEKELFNKYVIWDAIERRGKSLQMHQEAAAFGVQHTFTIIYKDNNGSHFYHFANNSSDQSINQTYINNIDLLNLFISYFNENTKASKTLSSAFDITFEIDKNAAGYTLQHNNLISHINKSKFLNEVKTNNSFMVPAAFYKESQKMRCLKLLSQGMTLKQIAIHLNISPRTVEHYLENLRKLISAKNNKELISIYFKQIVNSTPEF